MKRFLPTYHFLGNMVEAVPSVAHSLVTQYGETRQQTPSHTSHWCTNGNNSLFSCVFSFFMVTTSAYSPTSNSYYAHVRFFLTLDKKVMFLLILLLRYSLNSCYHHLNEVPEVKSSKFDLCSQKVRITNLPHGLYNVKPNPF